MVVTPVWVFTPESVSMPAPVLVMATARETPSEMIPLSVMLPAPAIFRDLMPAEPPPPFVPLIVPASVRVFVVLPLVRV